MSRIGKLPVKIGKGVKVDIRGQIVAVEGSKGKLARTMPPEISAKVDNGQILVARSDDSKRVKSLHGLWRSLINNMVVGVSDGFVRTLTIVGVGYRAEVQGQKLTLSVGHSSPVVYGIPDGATVEVEANTKITVRSADKQQVGQVSAEIRATRPPEHYKGKGIRYEDEYVRIKPGKTGVA